MCIVWGDVHVLLEHKAVPGQWLCEEHPRRLEENRATVGSS